MRILLPARIIQSSQIKELRTLSISSKIIRIKVTSCCRLLRNYSGPGMVVGALLTLPLISYQPSQVHPEPHFTDKELAVLLLSEVVTCLRLDRKHQSSRSRGLSTLSYLHNLRKELRYSYYKFNLLSVASKYAYFKIHPWLVSLPYSFLIHLDFPT